MFERLKQRANQAHALRVPMRTYANPSFGFTVEVPRDWAAGEPNITSKRLSISFATRPSPREAYNNLHVWAGRATIPVTDMVGPDDLSLQTFTDPHALLQKTVENFHSRNSNKMSAQVIKSEIRTRCGSPMLRVVCQIVDHVRNQPFESVREWVMFVEGQFSYQFMLGVIYPPAFAEASPIFTRVIESFKVTDVPR